MRGEPVDEADVQVRAAPFRHAPVGDVLDQCVLERPLALVGDRRVIVRADEVALLERVQARVDVRARAVQLGDGARPEDAPDDGRMLHDPLVLWRQPVEARADHRLQAPRHCELVEIPVAVEGAGIGEHANGLLEEERVAGRVPQQKLRVAASGKRVRAEQLGEERLAFLCAERREDERDRVLAVRAQCGPQLLAARGAPSR